MSYPIECSTRSCWTFCDDSDTASSILQYGTMIWVQQLMFWSVIKTPMKCMAQQ